MRRPSSESNARSIDADDDDPRERLAHLRGALQLAGAGVDLAAGLAQEIHRAIAALPRDVLHHHLSELPAVQAAFTVHAGVSEGVYTSVRGASRLVFGALDRAAELAGPELAPRARVPGPLVGLMHGIVGDRLAHSPLATSMHLRGRGRAVPLTRDALAAVLPDAGARVVLLVHGLAADESCWRLGSARAWGREHADYGTLLAERHGLTPLYLRYNSGLRIADNGRRLADLLTRLLAVYPGDLRELTLVGHSMGGLVVRSACHHGRLADAAWTHRVRDLVHLGAPHRGAVLERFGALAVRALAAVDVSAPLARALDRRSAGIKDLGRGLVCDDHEHERPLPWARHHYLAGTIGRAPIAWALGDGLVRVNSAIPRDLPRTSAEQLPGLGHVAMLCHPAVFTWLEAALTGPASGSQLREDPALPLDLELSAQPGAPREADPDHLDRA